MGSSNENVKPDDVDASKWPEVEAFEDDFTRSFIQSIEETSPGYYPFLSATGRYEMDFPGDAIIFGDNDNKITSDHTYTLQKDEYEYLRFYKEAQKYDVSVIVRYYSFLGNEGIDLTLERVAKRVDKELSYNEFINDDYTLYTASFEFSKNNDGYVAVIQNNQQEGNIQVIYDIQCKPGVKNCEEVLLNEQERMYDWFETIRFINEEAHESEEKDG
ncbi:hypothetical protein MM221_06455 [Salipaludibacillus sp. LMS25]|jgi:hypothetical protein|uniref:hypothetical protein n=1 Tax=Salipaludibacillus sp. LMS25 TaxID=2924031 RepID=UPI0020D0BE51|nr:hypothetical protein [Salipaludibacillus sp. LMS25]UTR16197.1 hypothetical protein MM221_06455 [Salipaludibacillus sp. LMS25]